MLSEGLIHSSLAAGWNMKVHHFHGIFCTMKGIFYLHYYVPLNIKRTARPEKYVQNFKRIPILSTYPAELNGANQCVHVIVIVIVTNDQEDFLDALCNP